MQTFKKHILYVNNLELDIYIGVTEQERLCPQKIAIDIKIYFDETPDACYTNLIDDTVCYNNIIQNIISYCNSKEFYLIENLSYEISNLCKENIKNHNINISTKITKKYPPILNFNGNVSFVYNHYHDSYYTKVVLGLGSNLGNKLRNILYAISELGHLIKEIRISPIYHTKPLMPSSACKSWNKMFLNAAISGYTSLSAIDLLRKIKDIENKIGRKSDKMWAPRKIDIDILVFGDLIYEDDILTIPHKQLLKRDFSLKPLVDLYPDWIYPAPGIFYNKTASEIYKILFSTIELDEVEI